MLGVGLALLILGAGNWAMGRAKLVQYQARMSEAVAIGGPAVRQPFRGTASILEDRTAAHETFAHARLKHEYYRVIHRGGLLLLILGGLLAGGALLRRVLVPSVDDSY